MSTAADYLRPVPFDWRRRVSDALALCALFAPGISVPGVWPW